MEEINSLEDFYKKVTDIYGNAKRNYNLHQIKINVAINIVDDANSVNITDCVFTEDFKFSSKVGISASFKGTVFEKGASFDNSYFERKARFIGTKFKGEASFSNTRFGDLVDFWGAEFSKPTIFYKTDFLGVTVFSTTTFYENVLFTYTLIDKVLILRGTNFKKGLDLSLTVLNGSLSTFDIRLNDFRTVSDTEIEEDYEELISKKAEIPEKNKRETFRILKKELQNQGNFFDALIYSSLETHTYFNQTKKKLLKRNSWNIIQDYLILQFNYYSNKNGKSWTRGILFTVLAGALFTYLSVISTETYCIGFNKMNWADLRQGMIFFFYSLLPTHDIDYLKDLNPTAWFYAWDFIGRTIIAYGIYQTVQAFRKFKST